MNYEQFFTGAPSAGEVKVATERNAFSVAEATPWGAFAVTRMDVVGRLDASATGSDEAGAEAFGNAEITPPDGTGRVPTDDGAGSRCAERSGRPPEAASAVPAATTPDAAATAIAIRRSPMWARFVLYKAAWGERVGHDERDG